MVRAMTQPIPSQEDQTVDAGPAAGVRWDLSDLYQGPDDPQLESDLDAARSAARDFAAHHRGRVASLDAGALADAIDRLEALGEPVAQVQAFAGLLFAADTSEPRRGALLQHVQERATEIRNLLVFFELEWAALEDDQAERLLGNPILERRSHFLRALRRYRPHLLSEPEEKILEESANTGRRAFSRLFDELIGSLRFLFEVDGETRELGEEEILARLYDPSRAVRAAAAAGLTEGLRGNARILTFIFNTLTQDKAVTDRLRCYADPIQERNLDNEIEDATVESLLRYAPISSEAGTRSFEDARRIVLAAYGDFSPEMAQIAGQFFERRWIDAELRSGKRGGAFSASTVPSVHPYVLLNYTGNLRDVMTVAHELGHGVHQYLSRDRGLFEQDTPLTTAETASVFGEMLVFRRLLAEESDPKTRLALLCGKLEDAFATVFRQVVMTRFEQAVHHARRHQGELPTERVNELWMESNRAMFDDAIELTEGYAWWWMYIPHFVHSPFYCYAYAFGELLVLALVRLYDEEGSAFVPRYLELLRAGGSAEPPALLERLGVDITDPSFWSGGLAVLEELVEQAEEVAAGCAG
jgi:oligoendopeptidase F